MYQTPERLTEELDYETLEKTIHVYLKRWGVLFRSLMEKESFAPPRRILVRVFRRMELRVELRGGRFVSQVSGEQFALAETIDQLRRVRKQPMTHELISLSAVDPLNLLGVILPGKKISNLTGNRIIFRDGIPLAVLEGKEVQYLKDLPTEEAWEVQKALVQRKFPSRLRYYLGKNYV
jgi:ATP-dependent helicase Lhr and Lhr-like helicase